jgi:hypothetical protein
MKMIPPSHKIVSIERAIPRAQSRDKHPNCDDCAEPAAFTIQTRTAEGNGGYLDLCDQHFEQRLITDPGFSARMVAGVVRDRLKA